MSIRQIVDELNLILQPPSIIERHPVDAAEVEGTDPTISCQIKKPDYLEAVEKRLKVMKDLSITRQEELKLQHQRLRAELLPPRLVDAVEQKLSSLAAQGYKFNSPTPNFLEQLNNPAPLSIDCAISERKTMVKTFEMLEAVSGNEISWENAVGSDSTQVVDHLKESLQKAVNEITRVRKPIEELKTAAVSTRDLSKILAKLNTK